MYNLGADSHKIMVGVNLYQEKEEGVMNTPSPQLHRFSYPCVSPGIVDTLFLGASYVR